MPHDSSKELNVTLNEFIPLERFNPEWAVFFRDADTRQFFVPTEMVVYRAEFVVPKIARAFGTGYHVFDNKYLSVDELARRVSAAGLDYSGYGKYPEIIMAEVWIDWGDDGHVEYQLRGYRFVLAETLNQYSKWYSEVPLCVVEQEFPR